MPERPIYIEPEAKETAVLIDRMVEELLAECGLQRVHRTGSTVAALAELVQYAINKRMERIDA